MRVVVDHENCIAAGVCSAVAPEIFAHDDSGKVVLVGSAEIPPESVDRVREAIALCPAGVIALDESEA